VSHFTRPAITLQGAHEVGPATPVVFRRRQNAKAAVGPIQFELFVQHARQQAGLNCIGFVLMVPRVGSELAPNGGPGLGVDQRPMLSGVELVLVRNLTDVDQVDSSL